MPQVPMIATKGFTYHTRRLMAGDAFEARNELDARILNRVRKVAAVSETAPLQVGGMADEEAKPVAIKAKAEPKNPAAKKPAAKKGKRKVAAKK